MHVQIDGGRIDRRLRWSDEIVGVHRLNHLFQDRKPAPGSRFAFPSYQPTLNAVVPIRVAVKDEESRAIGRRPQVAVAQSNCGRTRSRRRA